MSRGVMTYLLLLYGCPAVAQVERFQYRPERIDVGTVYHYVKTNIDGTHPEWISIRIEARDRIASFKFHPGDPPAALVTADMDWTTFSVRHLVSLRVMGDGSTSVAATLDYKPDERATYTTVPALGKSESERTAVGYVPVHVYNFDLASLNFSFRHLVKAEDTFRVGLIDPSFKKEGPAFFYRGEVDVSFVGDESRASSACRKYRIDGPGLDNRGGFIWVHKTGGHVVDMEIDLPDNPDWQTFKFKLERVEKMTPQEWDAFMSKQVK